MNKLSLLLLAVVCYHTVVGQYFTQCYCYCYYLVILRLLY